MFEYRKATTEDLERIWDKDIAENTGDPRYPEWKTQFINANKRKKIITFVVVADGDPVGQATLVLLKDVIDSEIKGILCNDRDTAYISTVRIEKQFEAQGHISKLFKLMEKTAPPSPQTFPEHTTTFQRLCSPMKYVPSFAE